MWLTLTLAAAQAAEPCYGFSHEHRVEGDAFWVEWSGDVVSDVDAQAVADMADEAGGVYRDLGWPMTDEPVLIRISEQGSFGIAGLTRTIQCDVGPVPVIDLFIGAWNLDDGLEVTAHEVAHVAEYGHMGAYDDSVASWLWWMEGTATWLTPQVTGHWLWWGHSADDYLSRPQMALHHGLEGFLDDDISDHMYGTTYVAESLAEYAGEDAILATWAWAGPRSGEVLYFPDAVSGAGVDFDAFWAHHLATLPTRQIDRREFIGEVDIAETVSALPADGGGADLEGMGAAIVKFPSSLGDDRRALSVSFDGDPAVPWQVVLVRTNGDEVLDYVPLDVVNGHADGYLPGFSRVSGWLVASPLVREADPRSWSWSAELVKDDRDALPGTVILGDAPSDGGGCATVPGGAVGAAVLALGIAATRRRQGGFGAA